VQIENTYQSIKLVKHLYSKLVKHLDSKLVTANTLVVIA